jgi:hypothetical protein
MTPHTLASLCDFGPKFAGLPIRRDLMVTQLNLIIRRKREVLTAAGVDPADVEQAVNELAAELGIIPDDWRAEAG